MKGRHGLTKTTKSVIVFESANGQLGDSFRIGAQQRVCLLPVQPACSGARDKADKKTLALDKGRPGLNAGRKMAVSNTALADKGLPSQATRTGWHRSWLPRALFGGLLFTLCGAVASYIVWSSYRNFHTAAVRDMANVASVITAYSERSLASAERVLASVQQNLRADGILETGRFRRDAATEEVHRRIVNSAQSVQEIGGIAIFDLDGNLLNVSRQWPVPRVNVADLDYFRAVRSGAERFISRPLFNRVNGELTLHLARPVRDGSGSLIGVMSAGMNLTQFSEIFGRLQLHSEHRIHLIRNDGVILTLYPLDRESLGTNFGAGIGDFDERAATSAVSTNTIVIDGNQQLIVSQRLGQFPMLVSISASASLILSQWLGEAIYLIVFSVTSCMLIVIATAYAISGARNTDTLWYFAYHDFLTDCPNRMSLKACLERLSAVSAIDRDDYYILYSDLDRFKKINDTLGHATGDELLIAVSKRLPKLLQYRGCRTEIVARLGGDEFAAVVRIPRGPRSEAIARAICDAIVTGMSEPFLVAGHRFNISASVGAVHWKDPAESATKVLADADEALSHAKSAGRATFCIFDDEMAQRARDHNQLSRDLRAGLDEPGMPDFEVHYQPIVDIQAMEIGWFEALIRWKHPTRGYVRPDRFVAIAEELGLTYRIGDFVMAAACRAALDWPSHIGVSINASSSQFQDGVITQSITKVLADCGIEPGRVILEITEGTLLDNAEFTIRQLRNLHELGIRIAIDDFGTGYSSLSYLKSFPFSKIKIDKSFISDMASNRGDQAVVHACCMLAQAMAITTTAEGVENVEQLRAVRSSGCREVQGYLFSRPVPLSEVSATIKSVSALAKSFLHAAEPVLLSERR